MHDGICWYITAWLHYHLSFSWLDGRIISSVSANSNAKRKGQNWEQGLIRGFILKHRCD
jgi:hypothetical protein